MKSPSVPLFRKGETKAGSCQRKGDKRSWAGRNGKGRPVDSGDEDHALRRNSSKTGQPVSGEALVADAPWIVQMTGNDIEAVLSIECRAFSIPWTRRAFEEALRSEHCAVVARKGGLTVGYAIAWVGHGQMHIVNLAVEEHFKRQGIAAALLRHLLDAARGMSVARAVLEVRVSNVAAIALYESQGFQKVALDRGYYLHPPEDAVIMVKDVCDERRTGAGGGGLPGRPGRSDGPLRDRSGLRPRGLC